MVVKKDSGVVLGAGFNFSIGLWPLHRNHLVLTCARATAEETGKKPNYLFMNGFHKAVKTDVDKILSLLTKVNSVVDRPIVITPDLLADNILPEWGENRTPIQIKKL